MSWKARRRIHDHLARYPGLHLREIARGVDLDANHVKYHLTALEKHGLVSSRREDGYWRFWPRTEGDLGHRDTLDRRDKDHLSLLRRPVPLHVSLLLLEHEAMSQVELLEHVSVSQSTLHYHLSKMEKKGLIASNKPGRERHYRLTDPDRTEALLIKHKPPDHLVQGFLEAWEQLELE